jgi:hypothetical protein
MSPAYFSLDHQLMAQKGNDSAGNGCLGVASYKVWFTTKGKFGFLHYVAFYCMPFTAPLFWFLKISKRR